MPIKKIRQYIDLCMQGPATVGLRKEIMQNHRRDILKQIDQLKKNLNIVDLKIAFYNTDAGSCAFISKPDDKMEK
jgi:DNA-binding transcriptional MerR regulator